MAGTVTVACKLPHGLRMDLMQPAAADGTRSTIPMQSVTLRGAALPAGVQTFGVVGGFGLTENVDEDFWNAWLEQNRDYEPVKRGLIFAQKPTKAAAEAEDREDLRSGLEPLNPDQSPVAGVTTAKD